MRQTRVEIQMAGADVTASLEPFLTKFSHSDSIAKKSDTIALSLFDQDWRHLRQWVIDKGTEIRAAIIQEDEAGAQRLECGRFQVDNLDFAIGTDGSHLEIKANSVPVKGTAKGSKKYRAWEGADPKTISEQVAGDSALEVKWEVEQNPGRLARTDQDGESDLEFLQRLCDENGHCMKVADGKVIVFDEEEYERREPFTELKPGVSAYDGMKLKTTANGKFKAAEASWSSPRTGKTIREKFTADEPPEGVGAELYNYRRYNRDGEDDDDELDDGDELRAAGARAGEHEWELASGNVGEKGGGRKAKGKKRASKELRQANKNEFTASFKVPGDVKWNAGQTFTLSQEFGKFGRKYIVEDVTHSVSRSDGYTCEVKAHATLAGY